MEALAWLRVLGSDAAGGHGGRGSRPPWGIGEGRNVPRVGGLGWARDAADPRTQAVPGDRKRKFACRSLSFFPLALLRCKSQELPLLGRGRFGAPKHSIFSYYSPFFSERGLGREAREGSRFVPSAAGVRAPQTGAGRGAPRGDLGGEGGPPRQPHPLSATFFPPALVLRRLSPVRLLCAHAELIASTGGRSGIFTPASRLWFLLSPLFPRGGRPGSDQVLYLQTVLQESALGCLPGWQ